jgi:hypothetical protein
VGIEYCWTSLVKTLGTPEIAKLPSKWSSLEYTASAITYFNNGYSEFEHTRPAASEREQQ